MNVEVTLRFDNILNTHVHIKHFFDSPPQQGQSPSIRQLIMHSMAEWYMRGEQYDQAKLSRILDVAQDLKVC